MKLPVVSSSFSILLIFASSSIRVYNFDSRFTPVFTWYSWSNCRKRSLFMAVMIGVQLRRMQLAITAVHSFKSGMEGSKQSCNSITVNHFYWNSVKITWYRAKMPAFERKLPWHNNNNNRNILHCVLLFPAMFYDAVHFFSKKGIYYNILFCHFNFDLSVI